MRRNPISEIEKEALKAYIDGVSLREIEERFGTSKARIDHLRKVHNIPSVRKKRYQSEDLITNVAKMYLEKHSVTEIAETLKIGVSTVYTNIYRAGLSPNRNYERDPEDPIKDIDLKRTYRISLKTYKRMRESQGNCCAICGKTEKEINRSDRSYPLSVDHDHKTGYVRGLLCDTCNRGLGIFKEDIEYLLKAAQYLKETSETDWRDKDLQQGMKVKKGEVVGWSI